jgi:hypothetical protein
LVRNLVEVASRGGNYLLNVGPTAEGGFPKEAVERLRHIGRWMERNHEAIYGSTYTPLQGATWGRATRKGNKVYLHLFDWPSAGRLEIDNFPGTAEAAGLMTEEPLEFSQAGPRLEIMVPPQAPDPDVSVLVVTIVEAEEGWTAYSPAVATTTAPKDYLRSQVIASAVINSILNGLIAFFAYRLRKHIPFPEATVDILITVAIISFLVAWIAVVLARGEIAKGNISPDVGPRANIRWPRLPKGAALRALIITIALVIAFGGLVMSGLLYLISPDGFSSWAYVVTKTAYTGVAAALAAALAILSVTGDENRG